jgi:hypothetical protein
MPKIGSFSSFGIQAKSRKQKAESKNDTDGLPVQYNLFIFIRLKTKLVRNLFMGKEYSILLFKSAGIGTFICKFALSLAGCKDYDD